MKAILYTDGGSRGNPGPAAIASVLLNETGKVINEIGSYIGTSTNNEAEYKALIQGLEAAHRMGVSELTCLLDSELVVRQLNGVYRVKEPRIRVLCDRVKTLAVAFESVQYIHVAREKNKRADALVNRVLDSAKS